MHVHPVRDADEFGNMRWEFTHKLMITGSGETARRDVVHEKIIFLRISALSARNNSMNIRAFCEK
jgi:hypothetical protein